MSGPALRNGLLLGSVAVSEGSAVTAIAAWAVTAGDWRAALASAGVAAVVLVAAVAVLWALVMRYRRRSRSGSD